MKTIATALAALCLLMMPAAPLGAQETAAAFDNATKSKVIDGAIKAFGDYVYPDVAAKAVASLREHREQYMKIDDPDAFAKAVTADLFASTNDLHEKLYYEATAIPEFRAPTKRDIHLMELQQANHMQGVTAVHQLIGNIGYMNIRMFMDAAHAAPVYDGAMKMLAHTDALIIDLRHNGGGSDAIHYLMGYFFAKPTHVNDFYYRGQPVEKAYTYAHVGGPRYLNKPIYILTSKGTGSAAEEFAYDMQTQHRGTIVGATTAGAANPGRMLKLSDHFKIYISLGYVENAVTHKNWEGTGVLPDVPTAQGAALLTAYGIALKAAKTTLDQTVLERKDALADPQKALDLSFSM